MGAALDLTAASLWRASSAALLPIQLLFQARASAEYGDHAEENQQLLLQFLPLPSRLSSSKPKRLVCANQAPCRRVRRLRPVLRELVASGALAFLDN